MVPPAVRARPIDRRGGTPCRRTGALRRARRGTRRYDRKGEYALAVRNFSTAIELDPTSADFYHNRGFAHRKQATPHRSLYIPAGKWERPKRERPKRERPKRDHRKQATPHPPQPIPACSRPW